MNISRLLACAFAALAACGGALQAADEPTSRTSGHLKKYLVKFPEADANSDGVLTASEAWAYHATYPQRVRAAAEARCKAADEAAKQGLPPPPGSVRPPPTHRNVRYGAADRAVLDVWLAKSGKLAPLVIFYHGGAWKIGDKKDISTFLIQACLDAGISVASVNYTFTTTAPLPAPHLDSARALQFLRSKAREWNLDPARVAAYGASAGAGISLWLAFHDDMAKPDSQDPVDRESTRLTCAGSINGQSTYDPHVIREWVGESAFRHGFSLAGYGVKTHAELDPARFQKLFDEVSPIKHLTLDDPPVYESYTEPDAPVPPGSKAGTGIHHPIFGHNLKARMDALGIECAYMHVVDIQGEAVLEMLEFFKRHFGMK